MSVTSSRASNGSVSRRQLSSLQRQYYTMSNANTQHKLWLFPKSQKVLMEEAMVRRREDEKQRKQYWGGATKYYDQINRSVGKFEQWSSPEAFRTSMEAYNKTKEREQRRDRLLVRRERLKQLLDREEEQFKQELMTQPMRGVRAREPTMEELRAQKERLRKERMKVQEKEAEEKMLQHWKLNNPEFRELQMKKHRQLVQLSWDEQRREQEAQQQREDDLERDRQQQEREAHLQRDQLLEREAEQRKKKLLKWKETVLWQIEEIRRKDRQQAELKEQVRTEQENEARLHQMEEKRRQMAERRKKVELGHFLNRQHRLKLLAKAERVERELEEDRHFLAELERVQEAEVEADESRRASRRKELQWMQKVLRDQEEEERRRRKQMDFMFTEEAESFWVKQERLWREEERAREKLMQDVVGNWRGQIEDKIKEADDRVREIGDESAQLRHDMETLTKEIDREEQEKAAARVTFVDGLEAQVAEKRDERQEQQRREEQEERTREERFRDTNELAARLAEWDLEGAEVGVTDFRRRRAKW